MQTSVFPQCVTLFFKYHKINGQKIEYIFRLNSQKKSFHSSTFIISVTKTSEHPRLVYYCLLLEHLL